MTTTVVVNSCGQKLAEKLLPARMVAGETTTTMGDHNTFADLLRARTAGKSQRDISMKARVSPTTIGNYLVGRLPDLNDFRLIESLASVCGVSPDYLRELIKGEGERRQAQQALERISADPVERIQFALNGVVLNDDQVERIKELAEKHRGQKGEREDEAS